MNLVVMLLGLLLTAAGASLLVTEHLHLASAWHQFSIVSWALLAAGLLTLTTAFLACCGSLISSKCLLTSFVLSLVCLVAGELTLGLLVYCQVSHRSQSHAAQIKMSPVSFLIHSPKLKSQLYRRPMFVPVAHFIAPDEYLNNAPFSVTR